MDELSGCVDAVKDPGVNLVGLTDLLPACRRESAGSCDCRCHVRSPSNKCALQLYSLAFPLTVHRSSLFFTFSATLCVSVCVCGHTCVCRGVFTCHSACKVSENNLGASTLFEEKASVLLPTVHPLTGPKCPQVLLSIPRISP